MIKKKDILLAVGIVAIALILLGILKLVHQTSGTQAVIRVNGEVYGTYDLSKDQEIMVDTEYGHNLVRIEDGQAYMAEADCPDGYCEHQGKISHENETIVCLPHKLVVEINSGQDSDISESQKSQNTPSYDAISQ